MRSRIAVVFLFIVGICFFVYSTLVNAQEYVDLSPRKGEYIFRGPSLTEFFYSSEFRLTPFGGANLLQVTSSRELTFSSVPRITTSGVFTGSNMFKACSSNSFTLTSAGAHTVASVSTTGRYTTQRIYVHGSTGGTFAFATADATRSLRVYLYSTSAAADLDYKDYDSVEYNSGGASNLGMFDSSVIAHATGYASDTYTLGLYLYGTTYNAFNLVQGRAKICAHELP